MLLFPLIYDVFVHEVVKLNSLCLTDVSFLHHLVAHFVQQDQDSVLKFIGLTSHNLKGFTAKQYTAKRYSWGRK